MEGVMKGICFLLLSYCLGFFTIDSGNEPSGYVTGRVVIQNETEMEGVYDAQVDLIKDSNNLVCRVKTDGDGYFKIGPVNPGTYTLKIFSAEVPDPQVIPNIPIAAQATRALGNIVLVSEV